MMQLSSFVRTVLIELYYLRLETPETRVRTLSWASSGHENT